MSIRPIMLSLHIVIWPTIQFITLLLCHIIASHNIIHIMSSSITTFFSLLFFLSINSIFYAQYVITGHQVTISPINSQLTFNAPLSLNIINLYQQSSITINLNNLHQNSHNHIIQVRIHFGIQVCTLTQSNHKQCGFSPPKL